MIILYNDVFFFEIVIEKICVTKDCKICAGHLKHGCENT